MESEVGRHLRRRQNRKALVITVKQNGAGTSFERDGGKVKAREIKEGLCGSVSARCG